MAPSLQGSHSEELPERVRIHSGQIIGTSALCAGNHDGNPLPSHGLVAGGLQAEHLPPSLAPLRPASHPERSARRSVAILSSSPTLCRDACPASFEVRRPSCRQ